MLNKPNKFLGQHFLKNKKILQEVVDAAELSKKDIVLEVGPGTGTLTELLAQKAKRVIAIEKDKNLIPVLREKFKDYKNVEIVQGDILQIPSKVEVQLPNNYKIVANIPYYITSRFLRLFLSNPKLRPKLMVLMVQKEVADRILAKDGKESLLSLSVKAYSTPTLVRYVSRNFFTPKPRVDSAIIKLKVSEAGVLTKKGINEKKFFEILRTAFQQKRKMLRHSLGKDIPKKYCQKRPEEISLGGFIEIYKFLS